MSKTEYPQLLVPWAYEKNNCVIFRSFKFKQDMCIREECGTEEWADKTTMNRETVKENISLMLTMCMRL